MTVNQVPAEGFVAPGFEAVRDAFSGIFAADGELGASLGVYAGGAAATNGAAISRRTPLTRPPPAAP